MSKASRASGGLGEESSSGKEEGNFVCNICLDSATDAVVSLCGHLFCWPCLHRWLEMKPEQQVCPVCKAAISRDKIIPLYGRGAAKHEAGGPLPPRPPGQRTEPSHSAGREFSGFGFGDGGFHMSFGIGAFPFRVLGSSINLGVGWLAPAPGTPEYDEDQFLSKVFLIIAFFFIAWLFVA